MNDNRGIVIVCTIFIALCAATAGYASTLGGQAQKRQLPRDNVFYEITNDAGDHGNFIETYHVPVPGTGRTVFCVVYSDQMEGGGGAGPSCDWDGFHKNR